MDHIITKCVSNARTASWKMANNLWRNKRSSNIPTELGDILGCALTNYETNGKPNKGINRLYRIIVSETAYLIWKIRNERRIRDGDTTTDIPNEMVERRWTNAINKRLTIDRFLTNENRFGKHAIEPKLVKATWTNCLKNEDSLPADWPNKTGVLVGIAHPYPSDRNR